MTRDGLIKMNKKQDITSRIPFAAYDQCYKAIASIENDFGDNILYFIKYDKSVLHFNYLLYN